MTLKDAYRILIDTVLDAGLQIEDIRRRRCHKEHFPVKGLAVKRLREAGAKWKMIGQVLGYVHHGQAMYALARFNGMEAAK